MSHLPVGFPIGFSLTYSVYKVPRLVVTFFQTISGIQRKSEHFIGQFAAFGAMVESGTSSLKALLLIALMHFILPAVVSLAFSEGMRKLGMIKNGYMKLNAND